MKMSLSIVALLITFSSYGLHGMFHSCLFDFNLPKDTCCANCVLSISRRHVIIESDYCAGSMCLYYNARLIVKNFNQPFLCLDTLDIVQHHKRKLVLPFYLFPDLNYLGVEMKRVRSIDMNEDEIHTHEARFWTPKLDNFSCFSKIYGLERFEIYTNEPFDLEVLRNSFETIKYLKVNADLGESDINALAKMSKMEVLDLTWCKPPVANVLMLRRITGLRSLKLSGKYSVEEKLLIKEALDCAVNFD